MRTAHANRGVLFLFSALLFSFLLGIAGTMGEASAEAGGGAVGKAVQRDIETLVGHCKANDIEKAAAYVAYRGPDKARRWRDVSNPSDENERRQVESVCTRIKGLLAGSSSRDFLEYSSERESEGTWHIWKVRFRGSTPQEAIFAMLKVKGHYVLGDID